MIYQIVCYDRKRLCDSLKEDIVQRVLPEPASRHQQRQERLAHVIFAL